MKYAVVVGVLILACASCEWNTPTAFMPSPSSAVVLVPDAPAVLSGNALAVRPTSFRTGTDIGTVWVAVVMSGTDIGSIAGNLEWDRASLMFTGRWLQAKFWRHDSPETLWCLSPQDGSVSISTTRPSSMSGMTGAGDVLYLEFAPLAGMPNAGARLTWASPMFYGPDGAVRVLTGGSYGGTIAVQ